MQETLPESRLTRECDAFCTAVQFLTQIPLPNRFAGEQPERLRVAFARSILYLPLVGGLITAATAIVASFLIKVTSAELALILAIAFEAVLTGAFHEDALADTCDALGGGWTREQVLAILKDSRLGTYGTLGLGLGVACRFFSLVSLADEQWLWYGVASLVASGALGRWGMIWLMHTLKPIEDRKTMASDLSGAESGKNLRYSALIGSPAILPWLWLDPWGVLAAVVASGLVLYAYRGKIRQRVGGSTGDLVGCSGYLVQLTVLVVASTRVAGVST